MRAVIVGAGPVGTFCAIALARRGHDVTLVDRDPGPRHANSWQRKGVMQFELPHFFRYWVRQILLAEMPEVWDALLDAGALPARPDGFPEALTGLQSRRSTFERAIWGVATAQPQITRVTGHADAVLSSKGRAAGVSVSGQEIPAELVIVATGRAGRLGDGLRRPAEGGPCGFSYASRMYRARRGVAPPGGGLPMISPHDGYYTIVFPQDDRTLSALIVRASDDADLAQLRHTTGYEAAAAEIPDLAPWTDQQDFEPITPVMAGGGLDNVFRGQLNERGRVPLAGLLFVGDAVCTTNPAAGRGVSLGLRQAQALIGLLNDGSDLEEVALRLDAWCIEHIHPWLTDHIYWDATLLARWRGADLDLDARLPSDVICAAGQVDPSIMAAAGPYLGMAAPPAILDSVADKARAVLKTGWRPPFAAGPSRDELVARLSELRPFEADELAS